jgi:glycosyltransferase involved in cell wall biosynthesis
VLTRGNNVRDIEAALDADPPPNPVHVIGLDVSDRALRWKRRLSATRPYYWLWQRTAARVALELDHEVGPFDVVHHATMSAFWMPVGVAALDRPLIIGPMSGGTLTPPRLRRYLGLRGRLSDRVRSVNVAFSARMRRGLFERANVIIAQNEQMRAFIEKQSPTRGRVRTHSHASDPTVDVALPAERLPIALFVGRLLTWKGLLLAIEAFAQVDVPGSRLVIVGDGPARSLIAQRVRTLGLEDRVDLTGSLPRNQVLGLMAEASCLLFPSFHDSAGFVVSEALSLGTPVVCLDHGGPGTLVKLWSSVPSEAIVPQDAERTVADLGAALTRVISNPMPVPPAPIPADRRLSEVIAETYLSIDSAMTR